MDDVFNGLRSLTSYMHCGQQDTAIADGEDGRGKFDWST